jgi:uncharacterized sporulation protein YeaH/YhbH (DUF444 family)
MTEKLPTTTYIFVDRRKTGRGKSMGNRSRLLRRISDAIRQARPADIDAGGVKAAGGAASPASNVNPVRVTKHSLHEPTLHYARGSGDHEIVLIGNDRRWERGDEFPLSSEGDGEGEGEPGQGEDGEDDFVVNISRDEFYNVFFEDCELPDMRETHEKDIPEAVPKHAGFTKEGNPSQLNVVRSYKQALPRRKILSKSAREELEELELKYQALLLELASQDTLASRQEEINLELQAMELRITELRQKIKNIPFFEHLDMRYTKKEKVLVKSADAVFIMIMDISGSMDEDKKRMARKFFALQYAFIVRKYPQTDLIFIAHTDDSEEMTEEEFFSTRKSGGTVVSPAYKLANDIIRVRYDAKDTNIYLSQASDGDNWESDNAQIIPALETSGLLGKLRHMSYAQVGAPPAYSMYSSGASLWQVLQSIASTSKKLAMVKITDDSEVFDAFHTVYKRKKQKVN